jgi:4-diphosphocytidyl-2-C-methyl-D-erythritol kinase
MYFRRDETTRTVRAPAKLNLFLDVFGQRGDRFHELATLIVPIRVWDSLSIVSTPPDSNGGPGPICLTVRNALSARATDQRHDAPPSGEKNLVVRALDLLRERSGCARGARVELVKRIPTAAGLGGGSSDAAAALMLANRVWGIGWTRRRLAEIAAELGSDVPFFLSGGAAICRGRGERVEPIPPVARLQVVVVKPLLGLSTGDVFRAHDTLVCPGKPASGSQLEKLVEALRQGRLSELGRWMTNGLQAAAATLLPWIGQVQSVFNRLDCLAHQLSGSGSAYFGICRHAQHARRVAAILKARQLGLVYATSSC